MNFDITGLVATLVVAGVILTVLIVDKLDERRDKSIVRRIHASHRKSCHRNSWRIKRNLEKDYISPKNDGGFVAVPMIGRVVELPNGQKFVVYPRIMPEPPKK